MFRTLAFLMLFATPALAQNPPIAGSISKVVCTDRSGAIVAGGTAQDAAPMNVSRKLLWVINASTTETLTFSIAGTATTNSMPLGTGIGFSWPAGTISSSAISVYAATTGHAFVVVECN